MERRKALFHLLRTRHNDGIELQIAHRGCVLGVSEQAAKQVAAYFSVAILAYGAPVFDAIHAVSFLIDVLSKPFVEKRSHASGVFLRVIGVRLGMLCPIDQP